MAPTPRQETGRGPLDPHLLRSEMASTLRLAHPRWRLRRAWHAQWRRGMRFPPTELRPQRAPPSQHGQGWQSRNNRETRAQEIAGGWILADLIEGKNGQPDGKQGAGDRRIASEVLAAVSHRALLTDPRRDPRWPSSASVVRWPEARIGRAAPQGYLVSHDGEIVRRLVAPRTAPSLLSSSRFSVREDELGAAPTYALPRSIEQAEVVRPDVDEVEPPCHPGAPRRRCLGTAPHR